MGDGDREGLRFLTGGGLTYSSGRCSGGNWPPSVDGRGKSIGVPSPFFLFVYLRFSAGLTEEVGDSAPTDWDSLPVIVLPALGGRLAFGGVTPPLASRFAAIFCSRASSALSRLDIMPSLGGRPGPRRRAGWSPLSPDSIDCTSLESSSFDLTLGLEGSLLSGLSLRAMSSISCSASISWAASMSASASASKSSSSCFCCGSSIRSAPVSPMGTSGNRKRIRTPPIWM